MLHHPTTCLIYMDLLYETGLYEKVVEFYENTFKEIFERARSKQKSAGLLLYDMNHTTIAVAALYKLVLIYFIYFTVIVLDTLKSNINISSERRYR